MMKQKKPTAHDVGWRAIEHAAASDLDNALGDAIDIVDSFGLNTGVYSLVALGVLYGIAAGKHQDRERKQLPTVNRWSYIDTKSGRNVYRMCMENGDFAPYRRAQARYYAESDMITGIKPARRQINKPEPCTTYTEFVERDLPHLSATLIDLDQRIVMLADAARQMAEREAVKIEMLESETT